MQVLETLKRIGKFHEAEQLMLEPIACPEQYRYRNKMTFSLGTNPEWLLDGSQEKLSQQPTIGETALHLLRILLADTFASSVYLSLPLDMIQ